MNLEASTQSLLEQFPNPGKMSISRMERRLERFGQIAFGGFGIVLFAAIVGIIYTVVTKMILTGTQPWVGFLLVLFIVFAALTLTYVVFNEDLKERKKKLNTIFGPRTITDAPPTTDRLLESPYFQPSQSAVEETTDLLPVENKTRKL
jgi:hypothetical protein